MEENENKSSIKLDYTIKTAEERSVFVQHLIENTPPAQFSEKYIEILSDYIIFAMDKKERKEKNILTENRMVTVNKRETSYQGLAEKFENGEDGLSNLIHEDKNTILTPKVSITAADVEEIPPLKDLKEAIEIVKAQEKKATGKRKYLLKKQLIEMCQQQYVIKNEYKPPIYGSGTAKSVIKADLNDIYGMDANGEPENKGLISFFNPKHLSALLCNYSALKEEAYGDFVHDGYYMMEDLDNLIEKTLKDNDPLYYDLSERFNLSDRKILYIGKGERKNNKGYQRFIDYLEYGTGLPKAHDGGRSIWQIKNNHKLNIFFISCKNASFYEYQLIEQYKKENNGNTPLANRNSGNSKTSKLDCKGCPRLNICSANK